MPTSENAGSRVREGTGELPRPRGIAGTVHDIARRRPPPPAGKGIAIAAIAIATLVAVGIQFATGMGPGNTVLRQREADEKTRLVAPEGPTPPAVPAPTPPRPAPSAPAPGTVTSNATERVVIVSDDEATAPFVPDAAAGIPIPEGLTPRTAGRLQMAFSALKGHRYMADAATRELPLIAREAPEAERAVVRAFVTERLESLVRSQRLRDVALDAALDLIADGTEDATALLAAAREVGLADDRAAAPALVLLDVAGQDADAVAAVKALLEDPRRPLHLRVLAARTYARWQGADTYPFDASLPAVVQRALRGP